jgi:CRP/FNR family transcriptional regulator, cyclic AMP receptor protein
MCDKIHTSKKKGATKMAAAVFDASDLDELVELGTLRTFPKNSVLIHEGDKSDQLYVVMSGRLKVFLADADGKEVIIDTRQFFGEMALDGEPRSASVITVEPSSLCVLQREQFKKFLADKPEAALALIYALIKRARTLTRTVGNLALLDVYGRVAHLLIESAMEEDGRLVVTDRISQVDIAKKVGSSREMVSRILGDLKEGGYISMDNNRIVIQQTLPKRW